VTLYKAFPLHAVYTQLISSLGYCILLRMCAIPSTIRFEGLLALLLLTVQWWLDKTRLQFMFAPSA